MIFEAFLWHFIFADLLYGAGCAKTHTFLSLTKTTVFGAISPIDFEKDQTRTSSNTGLPPEKAGTALRRMQEAGLVYELRPGRFGLTFDLAELESRQSSEATHIIIGPV